MLFVINSCPACLGLVGDPYSISFSSTKDYDLSFSYNFLKQDEGKFHREVNFLTLSIFRNFGKFSLGSTLPVYFAGGYMRDEKYHKVASLFGLDVGIKYYILRKIAPSRPSLYAFTFLKIPVGYLYHEEHAEKYIPVGFTLGFGGSFYPTTSWIIAGEGTYIKYLPTKIYTFGNRGKISLLLGRFVNTLSNLSLISTKVEVAYSSGDIGLEPSIKENTKYIYVSTGIGAGIFLETAHMLFNFSYIPIYSSSGNMTLPLKFSIGLTFILTL